MNDICSSSAGALAKAIRTKKLSATETVEAHLRRIEQVNPSLNAVVHLDAAGALAAARQADAALARGEPLGSLHGVPVTIKDTFDVEGMVCTAGTQGRAQHRSGSDSTVTARLKAAGAIVLGKTNVPELSLAYETDNLIYGRTANPYDAARTSGGSSGGEAAIIASGGSSLGVGTDIGGSLRVPAHYCGIASLKPTLGRVPLTGVFPPPVGVMGGMYHAGPLARSVDDLWLALTVLAGPDGADTRAVPAPLGDANAISLGRLRVAFHLANGVAEPDPDTAAVVTAAVETLRTAGCVVEEVCPPPMAECYDLFRTLFAADGGAGVGQLLSMSGTTQVHPLITRLGGILQPDAAGSAGEFGGRLIAWDMWRARMLGFMAGYDVLLAPVTASPAVPHGTTWDAENLPGFSYCMAHSLTGWPAAVVRCGASSSGLPIGVQAAAKPWREDVAVAVARALEAALGGWAPPA